MHAESTERTPFICILSMGSDPTELIMGLAKKKKKEVRLLSLSKVEHVNLRLVKPACQLKNSQSSMQRRRRWSRNERGLTKLVKWQVQSVSMGQGQEVIARRYVSSGQKPAPPFLHPKIVFSLSRPAPTVLSAAPTVLSAALTVFAEKLTVLQTQAWRRGHGCCSRTRTLASNTSRFPQN